MSVQPPRILQIVREPLRPGSEAAYHALEEDTARTAAALGCPHPYLAAETVTGPKEVWWFNGYESSAEQKQIRDEYASNARLMSALQQSSHRKASLTFPPIEVVAEHRPDSTRHAWVLGRGRFLVITVTKHDRTIPGAVFVAVDGTRVIVVSAQTREQADAMRAAAGEASVLLAVRPSWSFPDKDWIDADAEFWSPHGRSVGRGAM